MKVEKIQTNEIVVPQRSGDRISADQKQTLTSDAISFEGGRRDNTNQQQQKKEKESHETLSGSEAGTLNGSKSKHGGPLNVVA